MSVDVPALQKLVATIASGLGTVASTPTRESTAAALQEALAALEVLVTTLRDGELLRRSGELPTIEKLEHQYGRALARIIAALGGLPVLADERSATLARLLVEDAGARAALLSLDPKRDAELFETLYDLFVPSRAARSAAARPAYVIAAVTPPPPASEPDEPDPDLAPEHHVSGVQRVRPGAKPRKR
ncbi:MAG: hypothetical protein ACAI38_17310 [Myxococcota bacterium]|nr:hypothetical protein [Myxococcota bacterium]